MFHWTATLLMKNWTDASLKLYNFWGNSVPDLTSLGTVTRDQ